MASPATPSSSMRRLRPHKGPRSHCYIYAAKVFVKEWERGEVDHSFIHILKPIFR